ncbi:hypothetical protein A5662_03050 [Mycobacteriaceae bacterium 1482268.1]|nr:hypothetical protein A5662_03050 [Mycobacteriaceae bacterium 1482268.1]
MPETSYAPCGDLSLAYQVFGDGPIELVWAGSFASHVELYWTMPEFGSLMEKLGAFARILLFECELMGDDIGGIAVHIAARILGQADANEILVSRKVRDLVVGSGTGFDDRGIVELRGVPGRWELLAVNRHGAQVGSAEAELTSVATPGPRSGMRRADRAVAVMAKRTPWILRGMSRMVPAAKTANHGA